MTFWRQRCLWCCRPRAAHCLAASIPVPLSIAPKEPHAPREPPIPFSSPSSPPRPAGTGPGRPGPAVCGRPGPRHLPHRPRHRLPWQRHGGACGQGDRWRAQPHSGLPARLAGCAEPADQRRPCRARGRVQCAHRRPRCGRRLRQPAGRPHPRAGGSDRRGEGRGLGPAAGGWLSAQRGASRRGPGGSCVCQHRPPCRHANARTDHRHRRGAAQVRAGQRCARAPASAQAGGAGTGPQTPGGRA